MNKIPFKEVCDINTPEELYGRDSLLNQLVIDAKLKHNVNIIGARRFGKTCLALTACTLIKRMDISVYPVYINSKADIEGTPAVYRYMIGVLVESLYKDGVFTEPVMVRDIEIAPTDDWTEIAEKLEVLSASRIQSLFQKVVYFFSDLMDKTILFMIDEYEYLLKYALDTTAGFMKIRTMSADTLPNGSQPFCFWLIGATSWDNIITQVPGSGETNTVTAYEHVGPISKDSFFDMWDKECSLIENMEQKSFLISMREYAYEKSGGVPFLGKVIGSNILKNNVVPDYTCCLGHLQQLANKALNEGSYIILKDLAVSPKKLKPSNARNDLKDKGIIIEKEKETYCIAIGFIKDFILSEIAEKQGKVQTLPESYTLMKTITDKIELINKQRINYKKKPIFKLVYDYSSLENDLRTPCYTKEQISDFTSSLYKYFYERVKDSIGHKPFLYDTFGKCVNTARHSLGGGHEMDFFKVLDGQFSHADMLVEIMGSADELCLAQDFYKFQITMLKRFRDTLEDMYQKVKKGQIA